MENEIIVQIRIEKTDDEETTLQVENVAESEFGKSAASTILKQLAMVVTTMNYDDITVDDIVTGGE